MRLLDSVRDRCDRIRVDYLIDLFAVIDHHEVQVHRIWIRLAVDHSRSGAIRVDAIGPRAWGPLHQGRDAVEDYVIYLLGACHNVTSLRCILFISKVLLVLAKHTMKGVPSHKPLGELSEEHRRLAEEQLRLLKSFAKQE